MGRVRGDLCVRTFQFARTIVQLFDEMPNTAKARALGQQFLRSGTSIGANIREADHALTDREFAQRCSVARKEAAETHYWLELCHSIGLLRGALVPQVIQEADELTRVLVSVVRLTQGRLQKSKKRPRKAE